MKSSHLAGNEVPSQPGLRQGTTIVELLTAGALLATVIAMLAPFVSRISIVNNEIADRELALREVRNVITLMQAGVDEIELSATAQEQLDSPQLNIEKASLTGESLQTVTVSLVWMNRFGLPVTPVQLTFWVPEQESP